MWVPPFLISIAIVNIAAIKVPIDNTPIGNTNIVPMISEQKQSLPIYYTSDEANVDSYLFPPNPHKPAEANLDIFPTPATHLLPPAPDSVNEYFYKPTEPGEQTDWYPIAAMPQKQSEAAPINQQQILLEPNVAIENVRTGKELHRNQFITVPSRNLLPPQANAPDNFVLPSPSIELELPSEAIDHTLNKQISVQLPILRPSLEKTYPIHFRVKSTPQSASFILPPNTVLQEYKNPTKLYPKKYMSEFKPLPIPVNYYVDESNGIHVPIAKPVRFIKPGLHHNLQYSKPFDEKKNFLYQQSQEKNMLRNQNGEEKPAPVHDDNEEVSQTEQEASESNYRNPGNNPPELSHEPSVSKPGLKSKGERTEFRMHGMKGPHSYQFGFDTGKGKNRQFRYEERDNDGHVKGHYGYVDKFGKLRVVNYDADPEHGFRAESPVVNK